MKNKVCVGGFLMNGDRFLFCKRSKKKSWAAGLWDIAGGKSLKNEHPLYTLRRELDEELSVEVMNAELISSIDISGDVNRILFTYHIYMITAYNGQPVNSSNEHSKIKWLTRGELTTKSLALPEYLVMIDNLQGKSDVS